MKQKDFLEELAVLLNRYDVVISFKHLVGEIWVCDDNSLQVHNPIVDCRKRKGRGRDREKICNTTT